MEIVVYAANGLLKLMSENPLLIEIEEGHSLIYPTSSSPTALIPLMPGERLKGYPSGIAIGEKGLWGILPVDAENLAKSRLVLRLIPIVVLSKA